MRRFDKVKNIRKVNLLAEQRYFESKGLVNENVINDSNRDEWDKELTQIYTETFEELDIRVDGVLLEGKDIMNEAFGFAAISGAILASGKFVDLIGTLARKFQNWMVKKGWIKGDKWDKTKLEVWGEEMNKFFLNAIFKPLAGIIMAPIAALVIVSGGDGEAVMSKLDVVANTLFAGAVIILFGVNVWGMIKHHLTVLTGVVEAISNTTKLYEIILLIAALFFFKKVKKSLTDTAHTLGECLEAGGQYGTLMKKLKQLKNKSYAEEIKLCLMNATHH